MNRIFKYRILLQVRTDLTEEEIAKYEASKRNCHSPTTWPFRDTGVVLHAPRRKTACAFYRALNQVKPLLSIRAVRINETRPSRRHDDIQLRAWRGFKCLVGAIGGVQDEVKHFAVAHGQSACGLVFNEFSSINGKPECDKCLEAAVNAHSEMKQYL